MGEWFYVLIGACVMVLPFVSILGFRAARWRRSIGPAELGLALLPWALGLVGGYLLSHGAGESSLHCVANIRLLAAVTALRGGIETVALGTVLSGGLLLGLASTYFLARRSLSGFCALAVGVFAVTGALTSTALAEAMGSQLSTAPDQRTIALLEGAARYGTRGLVQICASGALLLVVAIAAWQAHRRGASATVRRGRLALALSLPLAVLVGQLGLDAYFDRIQRLAAIPAWAHVDEFRPLTGDSHYYAGGMPHAFVSAERVVPWSGEAFELGAVAKRDGRAAAGARFKELLAGPDPVDPALEELLELSGFEPNPALRRPARSLALAVDDRTPRNVFAGLFEALAAADIPRVILVGESTENRPSKSALAALGGLPFFEHAIVPTMAAAELMVGGATSRACQLSPQVVWYGNIGAGDTVTVKPWPNKDEFSHKRPTNELGSRELAKRDSEDIGFHYHSVICLALGPEAKPENVFRIALAAEEFNVPVALITAPAVDLGEAADVDPTLEERRQIWIPPRRM